MVEHKCALCGKTYTRTDAYKIHLNRKYPCAGGKTRLEMVEQELSDLKAEFAELKKIVDELRSYD